jgi:G:T-mismatch repair DNA endonuclease (very short patch repair protein)
MDRTCRRNGRDEKFVENVYWKTKLYGECRHRLEISLKYLGFDIVDWIHLAQDRDQLMAVVDMVVIHPAP